jgi:hypothetical protein
VHIPFEVIGPAQWDEDVLGIYWTLVMGSAASEKQEKEERTEAHEAWESRSHMKPPDLAGNSFNLKCTPNKTVI